MLDLDESQAGIEIAGRNISNLRYADDTTSMAKTEEEMTTQYSCLENLMDKGAYSATVQEVTKETWVSN